MRKIFTFALAALFSLLPFSTTSAQSPLDQVLRPQLVKMSASERLKAKSDFEREYPLLSQGMRLQPRFSSLPNASQSVVQRTSVKTIHGPLLADGKAELWGDIVYMGGWNDSINCVGYYSFLPQSPIEFSLLGHQTYPIAANGVQLKDDHIYGIYFDNTYAALGVIGVFLSDYDTETWTGTYKDMNRRYDLVALETAQAADGTVYGEFFNSSGKAMEWGTVDYITETRTTIGTAIRTYVAIGITKGGQLYGIAKDGNLYQIDKTNGRETLVGPTGLTLQNDQGRYYMQSGEIDPSTDTFYWYAIDINGNCGLYTVNLETGAAIKIGDYDAEMYGMIVHSPAAEDDAPGRAQSATLHFVQPSKEGTISFRAPVLTYGGNTLTGTLNYSITANDEEIAKGTVEAGDSVDVKVSVPQSGDTRFAIITSNSAGNSPRYILNQWIGYGVPYRVTNFTATQDGPYKAVLKWGKPNRTHAGCPSEFLGPLTYNVYRMSWRDTVLIAENVVDTTYTDSVSDYGIYSWLVTAKTESMEGEGQDCLNLVLGEAIDPDWGTNFDKHDPYDTYNDFKLFKVIDANNDKNRWSINWSTHEARTKNGSKDGNDDWLLTPPFRLTAGRIYNVTFKTKNKYDTNGRINTYEVKWGGGDSIDAMTNILLETNTPGKEFELHTYEIVPDSDGLYRIGFHDNTTGNVRGWISLDSVGIAKGAFAASPDSVTSLKATPGARGALNATLSFVAPTNAINGSKIETIDSIVVIRDGDEIGKLTNVAAGSENSYKDDDGVENGLHTYTLVPYINDGFGRSAKTTIFVGQDVPGTPQNLSLLDNDGKMLAMWNPYTEKGGNGGYINPDRVSVSFYSILTSNNTRYIADSLATSEEGATRVSIAKDPELSTDADGKSQHLFQLAARANGDAGHSDFITTPGIVVGPSIALPYKESASGGYLENDFAWVEGNEQTSKRASAAGWRLVGDYSSDNDGGSFLWSPYNQTTYYGVAAYDVLAGDEVSLNLAKVSLKGAVSPKLYFDVNAPKGTKAKLKVLVQTPDGIDHTLNTFDLSSSNGNWEQKNIDLGVYSSERYIIAKFRGIAEADSTAIGIDNVNIFDQFDYNLAVKSFNVPKRVNAGQTGRAEVVVENMGSHPAESYSVALFVNDSVVSNVDVDKALPVLESDTISLPLPVAFNETANRLNVRAEIDYDMDLDNDDNASEVKTVGVGLNEYNRIADLKAEPVDGGKVDLTWTKPIADAPIRVTEDFETYAPFATDFDDWTTVDGNKGLGGRLFTRYAYPTQGKQFAFTAFNPNAITTDFNVVESNPGLTPHSGNQYAAAPFEVSNTGLAIDADNWLISPKISGQAQTVTFFAMNLASGGTVFPEKFDVLYTTNADPADTAGFVKIESDKVDGTTDLTKGSNWKEFSVNIPEGATYFAIHHNSSYSGRFFFAIDDISFEKGAASTGDSITGFNVYRDGKLIGTVKGDEASFTDDPDNGCYVYNVTVLYVSKDGKTTESGYSNSASVIVTGIDNIAADAEGRYNVYTLDGKMVMVNAKSLHGLKHGVYIINDKKYIVK